MGIILTGGKSLEETFTEKNQKEVIKKMQAAKKEEIKIVCKVFLLVRQEVTMAGLLN